MKRALFPGMLLLLAAQAGAIEGSCHVIYSDGFGRCSQPALQFDCENPTDPIDPNGPDEVSRTYTLEDCPVTEELMGSCHFVNSTYSSEAFYYLYSPSEFNFAELSDELRQSCESRDNIWSFPRPPANPGAPTAENFIQSGGAQVNCGNINSDDADIVDLSFDVASCANFSNTVAASGDLIDATVRVRADATDPAVHPSDFADVDASAIITDLITITEGFDDQGSISGTFELAIDGAIDVSQLDYDSSVNFYIIVYYPDDEPPACLDDTDDCFIFGNYDLAEFFFGVTGGLVDSNPITSLGGRADLISLSPDDVRATLSVPWSVTRESPSFYIVAYGAISQFNRGAANFFNTAKGRIFSPADDFVYQGKNGFAATGENAAEATGPVRLNGQVETADGTQVNAMVLASGQYLFSNSPVGQYDLGALPRESDGGVRRQVYANGFVPKIEVLRGTTAESVVLASSGQCPNFNAGSTPEARPEAAGELHTLSGRVVAASNSESVRAMVLVNGQFDFADADGNYEVEFPLDSQGQFVRQVYAAGFAPAIKKYDVSTANLDVRLTRLSQCE